MITPPRSRSRAGLWIVVIVVLSLIGGLVIWLLRQSNRSFESFDMAGGPLVITDSTSGEAVTITSHWEKREFVTNDNTIVRESRLHWDVWAFSLRDLSRNWVTRLATIKNGDRNIDAAILGADSDVIWLLADDIMAVSTKDGHVVADAAAIEAKNPVLRGMMPRSARQIAFDDGLVILAADGRRWHVDSRTLNATPAATSNSADGRRKTYRTLRLLSQYQHYKTRSYQVDGRWYGLVHASEAAALQREMIGQSFASPLRYSLWSAPMRDTVDRFGNKGVTPGKLAPLAASEEFLQGGLLAVPDTAGTERVIGIAKPTRLLVLHQTRIDDDGTQQLSCVELSGRTCWTASLNMSLATGFVPLAAGGPSDWALFVVGLHHAPAAPNARYRSADEFPVLSRVRVTDGAVLRMSFADIDLAKLSDELKPYRAWKR